MRYSLDGGELQDYTGGFSMSADGVHTVEAHAADGSTKTVGFAIDTTDPTVAMTTPAPGARRRPRPRLDSSCQLRLRRRGLGRAVVYGESCVGPAARPELGRNEDDLCHGHRRRRAQLHADADVRGRLPRHPLLQLSDRPPRHLRNRRGRRDARAADEPLGDRGRAGVVTRSQPDRLHEHARRQLRALPPRGCHRRRDEADDASRDRHFAGLLPDGSQIAFPSNRGAGRNWDIYVIGSSGGAATRLTTNSASDVLSAWSPDGTQLAFMSTRTAKGDIYRLNLASPATTQVRLTSGPSASGIDTEPAWFGNRIAFSTNRHGSSNFELYVLNTTTLAQTRLTSQPGHQITPSWSRDGKKIAFMSSATGNGDTYVAELPNPLAVIPVTAQNQLTSHTAIDALPDW